jgi:hypothetical protein
MKNPDVARLARSEASRLGFFTVQRPSTPRLTLSVLVNLGEREMIPAGLVALVPLCSPEAVRRTGRPGGEASRGAAL